MAGTGDEQLVLYLVPGSFFCQMALLALHEKGLQYTPHFVNIFKMENIHPWFLKLNPKAKIPVLRDGEHVVPGSDLIYIYLDEQNHAESVPKLIPPRGSEEFDKVEKFDKLFRSIRTYLITFGSLNCPELCSSESQIPKYECELRTEVFEKAEVHTKRIEERFPEVKDLISQRRPKTAGLARLVRTITEVQKEIEVVGSVLDQVEKELALHNQGQDNWWLCSEQFTTADITLAILLHRLDLLGHTSNLLESQTKPCLVKYAGRVRQRPAYQAFLSDLERLHKEFEGTLSTSGKI